MTRDEIDKCTVRRVLVDTKATKNHVSAMFQGDEHE